MTVRRKALLVIAATLFAMISVVFAISAAILMKGASRNERNQVRQVLRRANDALARDIALLGSMVQDYAAWDDTYAFINDANAGYITANCGDDTLIKNRFNFMVYTDLSGQIVFAKCMNVSGAEAQSGTEGEAEAAWEEIPLPESLRERFVPGTVLTSHSLTGNVSGVLMLRDRPILVASCPILTSRYEGPSRGALTMGRFLDQHEVEELSRISSLPLLFHRLDQPARLDPVLQAVWKNLSAEEPLCSRVIDRNTIGGYRLVLDVFGKPALILAVWQSRDIHAQMVNSLLVLLFSIVTVGLVVGAVTLGLLNRLILRRISLLTTFVRDVKSTDSLSLRVSLPGEDELSELSESMNGMLGTLEEDVAERKRTEESLRSVRELEMAKETAEASSRAKSLFLAHMAHELRTPLAGMMGMAELVLEMDLTEEQMRVFRTIHTEVELLAEAISGVLDFSKIETGKVDLETSPFNLCQLVDVVSDSFALQAERKGLKFELFLSSDVPVLLKGDAARLRQILVNLLGNAVKFTHRGKIGARVELAGGDANRPEIRFSISDTGIGIPRDKIEHIFESFTQVDSSTTRKYGGTGLGTTISKRLVELMGGRIGAESKEGVGSTFWFQIPFTRQTEEDIAAEAARECQAAAAKTPVRRHLREDTGGPIRILLVEDYPTIQEIAMTHLTKAGYRVDLAENGQEGVEAWKSRQYDLILMDIQMPIMDGLDATKAIRDLEVHPGDAEGCPHTRKRVPIVALTAHAVQEYLGRCKTAGMDDSLTKPLKKKDLLGMVEKWTQPQNRPAFPPFKEAEKPPTEARPGQVMDYDRALEEFESDQNFLLATCSEFIDNVRSEIGRMREAIKSGKAETVRSESHRIRGGAANLNAEEFSRSAHVLERIGESGVLTDAPAALGELEKEFERFVGFINDIARNGGPNRENVSRG